LAELDDVLVAALIGYLIGSLPAAYLVGRLAGGIDVRTAGEGNAGSRNVFHEVGAGWGLAVFAADFGKGVAVALLFRDGSLWALGAASAFVVIGHAYPIWLRFAGGKGLAAAGGVAATLLPLAAVAVGAGAAGIVWLLTRRFLPTVVTVVVTAFVTAPFTGGEWGLMVLALGAFLLVAAKRLIDEPRMREVESQTGWDRARGGTRR
jgi:glycerol-3-phosphate acyltransferase PlsY